MENINIQPTSKRPALLTVLCIMTFLCSGFATLVSLAGIFVSEYIMDVLEPYAPQLVSYSNSGLIIFFLISVIIWGLSLWGSILMFNRRKGGFVLYIIPNGLLLIVQLVLMISYFNPLSLVFTLMSILFIILYATQVKYMRE